jgi:hypothetical protein
MIKTDVSFTTIILSLFFLLQPLIPSFAEDSQYFFDQEYLELVINNQNKENDFLFFESNRISGIYSGKYFLYNRKSFFQYYIEYKNYNIILLTEKIDNTIMIVRDFILIEKIYPDSYLSSGAIQINDTYYDWDISVVVNSKFDGLFTTNISCAYKINFDLGKIEVFEYTTIKLYREI